MVQIDKQTNNQIQEQYCGYKKNNNNNRIKSRSDSTDSGWGLEPNKMKIIMMMLELVLVLVMMMVVMIDISVKIKWFSILTISDFLSLSRSSRSFYLVFYLHFIKRYHIRRKNFAILNEFFFFGRKKKQISNWIEIKITKNRKKIAYNMNNLSIKKNSKERERERDCWRKKNFWPFTCDWMDIVMDIKISSFTPLLLFHLQNNRSVLSLLDWNEAWT